MTNTMEEKKDGAGCAEEKKAVKKVVVEKTIKEYQAENKKLLQRVSDQNQIIHHLSKLEDLGGIDRDTRSGFKLYYAHRQKAFLDMFGMKYSKVNVEKAYDNTQDTARRNKGINPIPCDMAERIKNEMGLR